jgi:hypothetical protein
MRCPPDKQPFFIDEDGNQSPLFVPPSMLDEARQAWVRLWIEPTPMIDPSAPPSTDPQSK